MSVFAPDSPMEEIGNRQFLGLLPHSPIRPKWMSHVNLWVFPPSEEETLDPRAFIASGRSNATDEVLKSAVHQTHGRSHASPGVHTGIKPAGQWGLHCTASKTPGLIGRVHADPWSATSALQYIHDQCCQEPKKYRSVPADPKKGKENSLSNEPNFKLSRLALQRQECRFYRASNYLGIWITCVHIQVNQYRSVLHSLKCYSGPVLLTDI